MIRSVPGSKPNSVVGIAGRSFLTLFFLIFFGMGAVFTWLVAREAVAGIRTWMWPSTGCRILRSEVGATDSRGRQTGDYYLHVEYQYAYRGENFVSDRVQPRPRSYQDIGKVERLLQGFQPGMLATCYVDPNQPAQAVLQRGSLWFPLLIFFPLIFVAIGAIGIYSAWTRSPLNSAQSMPISERARGVGGKRLGLALFTLFTVVGLAAFYAIGLRPTLLVLSARNWPAVKCTVLSSRVRSHSGNHGSTYSVDILYSYSVNGREYRANRYDFMGGSSSGYAGKQAIIDRCPPGAQRVCYVDPRDSTQAVLERGFRPVMLIGLFPLLFVAAGVFGLISIQRKSGDSSIQYSAKPTEFPTRAKVSTGITENYSNEPLVLKPAHSPLAKFVGICCVALFWNGIVSVFLVVLFQSWKSGPLQWFLALFLIPFVLVGLGLIGAAGYFFLSIFNPRPRITVSPGTPHLGDSVTLSWELSGRTEVLRDLRVIVTGREEATYSRGTRSSTDKNVFADIEVSRLSSTRDMVSGSAQVSIPADSMHSFSVTHNKIVWVIQVKGDIARWPDLNEEFPLTVLPAKIL